MSLRIPYYPGCSQVGTSADYDQSVRAVAKVLGIELLDIEDWTCCGSTPAHTIDTRLSAALSARNLRQVKDAGGDSAVTPCPSCLANLKNAEKKIANDVMREKVNKLLDTPYEGGVTSKSFLQVVFEEIGSKGIAEKVVKSLKGLTLAPYYGCLTTKPGGLMDFDDQENPISMDELMKAAGAKVPYFSFKTECCGASMAIPRNDAVTKLSGQIIDMAERVGADCIVVACPLCQLNLDLRRSQIESANRIRNRIPVFYFTQLLGLAFGLSEDELGIKKLAVDPRPVIDKINAALTDDTE